MFGINQKDRDKVMSSITPTIEKVADRRVEAVMAKIQKDQIIAYEEFFKRQEERFDDVLYKELNTDRTRKVIKSIVIEILEEVGVIK